MKLQTFIRGDNLANSAIISKLKDVVIKDIINDENIFYAIDSPMHSDFELSDSLVNTHVFGYNQNPKTLEKAITFLTIQTHISDNLDREGKWVNCILEIWIISHESCMKVRNIPQITANKNDYISQLLDDKFNGRRDIGYGELVLKSNIEDMLEPSYPCRKMIFFTKDLNDSLCEKEYYD